MRNRPHIAANVAATARGIALLLTFFSLAPAAHAVDDVLDLASFPQSSLTIKATRGEQHFSVWLASTWPQRAQGLMYVRDLPADQGMLFIDSQSRVTRMWMKNTYIPLDMLFIDAKGKIARVAAMTVPFSLQEVSSGVPVLAVLELKGGEAARRGIRVGDRVLHPAFGTAKKAGP